MRPLTSIFSTGQMPDGPGFYSRQMPHYVEPNRGQMPGGFPGGMITLGIDQGRGRRLVKFSYLNHPTKVDVTSGQIGAQQPVSAKSNDGVRVRHDFFGFLSHPYQEL